MPRTVPIGELRARLKDAKTSKRVAEKAVKEAVRDKTRAEKRELAAGKKVGRADVLIEKIESQIAAATM